MSSVQLNSQGPQALTKRACMISLRVSQYNLLLTNVPGRQRWKTRTFSGETNLLSLHIFSCLQSNDLLPPMYVRERTWRFPSFKAYFTLFQYAFPGWGCDKNLRGRDVCLVLASADLSIQSIKLTNRAVTWKNFHFYKEPCFRFPHLGGSHSLCIPQQARSQVINDTIRKIHAHTI